MTYLFTGPLPPFGTCEGRRRGLVKAGRDVVAESYLPFFRFWPGKLRTIQHLLGCGPAIWNYNRHLVLRARQTKCQVLWVEKGELVSRETLERIKRDTGALLVCYNTDDIKYKNNGWRLHLPSIDCYDIYFTTNRFNVPELRDMGARNVILTQLGYDAETYRPVNVTPDERRLLGADVGFIGHWERATEQLLSRALSLGLPLRVRGASWNKVTKNTDLSRVSSAIFLDPSDYCKAIVSTKVNLGLNATQSRNLSSGRTFEIPAAGGFLLGARTSEHQAFYEEGTEAEFFDSAEELADKARFYVANELARQRVAAAGHTRCLTSGYSWHELMAGMAKVVESYL